MAHLLRIVMIHGHLNGVVELSVDGHTNICGTNASGKTTLQRLVPVFYGELPNKVVPKTRMKFDAFYLPHRNSYLVYEYRREAGNVCQAVLTRKQEGGVEYRFVGAPYRPEDYLVETEQGPLALDYTQWASGLRRSGTPVSPKLGATSEFRSVIQNDFTQLHGNSRDGLKLRQIAAQFSLVNPERRIRHIEKLVSAVHAKEGKMDTLKTMLAAIFEEDGVELPVTRIRSAKAREWIHQMRQSMRLEPLQAALAKLSGIDRELAELDTTLWQLKPQLAADREQAQRQVADLEGELNRHQREFQAEEQAYGERRDALNDQHSEVASQLQHTQHRLNDLQTRFEQYADADMPGLERDINALPQWREQRDQLQQHLQVMQDAVKESQARLDGRLRELSENLARQTQENQELIDALGLEKPILMGHSLGGAISCATALRAPDKIGGLALIAPLLRPSEMQAKSFAALGITNPRTRRFVAHTVAVPTSAKNADLTRTEIFGPDPVPDGYTVKGGGLLSLRPKSFINTSRDYCAVGEVIVKQWKRYDEITCPVRVLYGTEDRILDYRKQGVEMADRYPHFHLALIEGAGHMLPLTQVDRTVETIRAVDRAI